MVWCGWKSVRMMKSSKLVAALPFLSLVVSSVLAGAWLSEQWFGTVSPTVRWALMISALAVSAVAVMAHARGANRAQESINRYFDTLCQMNHRELRRGISSDMLPSVSPRDPWFAVFTQVTDCLLSYAERVEQADHGRAALEIRAHRAAERCANLEAIVTGLPEPVVAVDEYDDVLIANSSAEQLLEFDSHDSRQRALSQLVHCEALVDLLLETRRRRVDTMRTAELQISDEEGTSRWYSVTAHGIAPSPGNEEEAVDTRMHGAVAMLHDISGQKALQQRNAEFVSAVSHEMKTPLAGIKAYVELLVDGDAEDEATREEFLEVINSQADRLQRLVDNMLNLARIEAGVVNVNKQAQSLNELLEEAISLIQPAAEQKQINLVADLSGMYLAVLVDRDMAMQSAINLLSNAIKYTPAKGKVTLRSRPNGNEVMFEVEDTGVGLSDEDTSKVFEKFYRVKKNHNMASGTGLGLALAKHIVEDVHSGKLTVTSKLGVGSKFTITLPKAGQIS